MLSTTLRHFFSFIFFHHCREANRGYIYCFLHASHTRSVNQPFSCLPAIDCILHFLPSLDCPLHPLPLPSTLPPFAFSFWCQARRTLAVCVCVCRPSRAALRATCHHCIPLTCLVAFAWPAGCTCFDELPHAENQMHRSCFPLHCILEQCCRHQGWVLSWPNVAPTRL